jgi:hypothetical protein
LEKTPSASLAVPAEKMPVDLSTARDKPPAAAPATSSAAAPSTQTAPATPGQSRSLVPFSLSDLEALLTRLVKPAEPAPDEATKPTPEKQPTVPASSAR